MDIKFVSELDKLLLKQKKIVIIPHRNPDGDALVKYEKYFPTQRRAH